MKNHFYKVLGRRDGGHHVHKLGYTSDKKACLRHFVKYGWKKRQLAFVEMGIERTDEFGQRI